MHTPVRPPFVLLTILLSAVLTTGCGGGADDRVVADASASAAEPAGRALATASARRAAAGGPADDASVSPHDGLPDPTVARPASVPPVAWPPTPPAATTDRSGPHD